jgi:hypothetical protein
VQVAGAHAQRVEPSSRAVELAAPGDLGEAVEGEDGTDQQAQGEEAEVELVEGGQVLGVHATAFSLEACEEPAHRSRGRAT